MICDRTPEACLDKAAVIASGILASYRRAMNWANGQPPQDTRGNWNRVIAWHA